MIYIISQCILEIMSFNGTYFLSYMVGFNKDLHLKSYVSIYFNKSELFLPK